MMDNSAPQQVCPHPTSLVYKPKTLGAVNILTEETDPRNGHNKESKQHSMNREEGKPPLTRRLGQVSEWGTL